MRTGLQRGTMVLEWVSMRLGRPLHVRKPELLDMQLALQNFKLTLGL